jgi:hypothetical protein
MNETERPLRDDEIVARLNDLLEGERAGAQGLHELAKRHAGDVASLLDSVARDEGRFCVMLRRHITRLGGEPSDKTGVFYDKLMGKLTFASQLKLLDRGQGAVVTMLDEILSRLDDAELAGDLREMREVHVVNIRRCAEVDAGPP